MSRHLFLDQVSSPSSSDLRLLTSVDRTATEMIVVSLETQIYLHGIRGSVCVY